MIRIERTPRGELRISGALDGASLSRLLEATKHQDLVLDLSEVSEADAVAVRILASLDSLRKVINSPRWLVLWMERERQPHPW